MENKKASKMKPTKFKYIPSVGKEANANIRKKKFSLEIDPQCQEATPEILRIEIEQIFRDFLGDPDQEEYIFPPNLNNLQRKFIHKKAQSLNLTSKSHGKEPNRQIHLKKKKNQLGNMSFVISPGKDTINCVMYLKEDIGQTDPYLPITHKHHIEKNINRLWNSQASIPSVVNVGQKILDMRSNLPIFDYRNEIINTIIENQVVIVSSETGSGKTTQIPQYIMEYMNSAQKTCKIICTQPRRISTVSAAERVSFERGEKVGNSVGYHIRLEQKYGLMTNLIYCTTGVFVRNLMSGGKKLTNISHIILDEIHERDKLSDFLLICLKQILPYHPDLKVILMSATLSAEKFQEYFGCGSILQIPGRLFPISTSYLEDILVSTGYMSSKMRVLQNKEQQKTENIVKKEEEKYFGINEMMDEALEEYLNFCENYDYRVHYEEATAQLGMYFLSEGVPVDYQHSSNGRTALMIAAHLGDKEFITRLCNMGANMGLCDEMGKTAFDYGRDNSEVLQLLEYIKLHRQKCNSNETDNKAEKLLELYDKTTSDDFIDFDLLVTLIGCIHNVNAPGGILVFLPGYDDIMMCNDRILSSSIDPTTIRIFFLHSSMNIRDQHEVFKKIPDKRKIILSTNIAETSLTIDDVVYVIDTGKCKEKCFDSYNKVSSLQTCWISQACAEQRKGRAGRTSPGMVFRLYSKQRFDNMDKERIPEMLRISLEEICLHAKILAPEGMNIHNFLMMAIDAPSGNSIKVAIEKLQFLGALDKEEDLTILGRYLAQLATEPHLGKMLLFSVIFKCLEPVLTLVASMSHKDPFQLPPQANLRSVATDLRKKLLNGYMSDHLFFLQIFKEWQDQCVNGNGYNFCRKYFVSYPTMNSILETRSQLLAQLRSINFIHQSSSLEEYNLNASSWPLVKAVMSTGLYPNLAYPKNGYLTNRRDKKIFVSNTSCCHNKPIFGHWLMYDEMIKKTPNMYIKGVSPISTLSVALMCGNDVIYPTPNIIQIDDWIEFQYPFQEINNLRKRIEFLIKTLMIVPNYKYSAFDNKIVRTVRDILNIEEELINLPYPRNIGEKPKFLLPIKEYVNMKPSNNYQRNDQQNWRGPRSSTVAKENSPQKRENWRKSKNSEQDDNNKVKNQGMTSFTTNSEDNTRTPKDPNSSIIYYNSDYNFDRPSAGLQNRNNSSSYLENSNNYQQSSGESNGIVNNSLKIFTINSNSGFSTDHEKNQARKFGEYRDENMYFLIKPKSVNSINIAFNTSRWVFAPQTENKMVYFKEKGKKIYAVFTAFSTNAFQGVARFVELQARPGARPTAVIKWIFRGHIPHNQIRHLKNPYNENKPIFSGLDGQVIHQSVAEELCRIFEAKTHFDLRVNCQSAQSNSNHRLDIESVPSTSRCRWNGYGTYQQSSEFRYSPKK